MLFQGGINEVLKFRFFKKPVHFLDGKSVASVLIDHENGLWVSTLDNGIYFSPSLNMSIFNQIPELNDEIINVTAVNNGVIAVSRNLEFIFVDSAYNSKKYLTIDRNALFDNYKILNYKNKLLLSGAVSGIVDKEFKELSKIKNHLGIELASQDVAIGNGDTVYYLTYNNIITYCNLKIVDNIKLPARGRTFLKTGPNEFLIGTLTGLYRYKNNSFTYLANENPSLGTRINYLFKDSCNRIWICTKGKGILFYKNNIWQQITKANGLASDLCNGIVEQKQNTYYVGTLDGLNKVIFNSDTSYRVESYNVSNGLPANEIFSLESYKNELWIGTSKGLAKINVNSNLLNDVSPTVYFNRIYINDTILINPNERNDFEYYQNSLTFNVDVLSFKTIGKTKFRYELLIDGKKLIKEVVGNKFELQNLRPGDYTLEIYGLNNNDRSSIVPSRFVFKIQSPFWLEGWFFSLILVIAISLVYLFLRYKISSQRAKQQREFEIEKKLSSFKLQALSAQMNPHFVFNAINSIQSQILQKNRHEAYGYLTKFSQLIRLILNNTNEITVPLSKEIEALKLYIELEQLRFMEKFDFDLLLATEVDAENTMIPSMIIQPFLENAIWHGLMPLNSIRKGKLTIQITPLGEKIVIIIEDNGIGRSKSAEIQKGVNHKSLGISLTKQRLELISKTGSEILISDLLDEQNNIKGTRIKLII